MEKAIALMEEDLFKTIPTDEVALIAARTEEVRFEAGEVIPSTGESATSFFFILDGEVEQLRGGVVVRRALKGYAFGLLRLLGVEEAVFDEVRITRDTHALSLHQEAFLEAVADYPAFANAFIRGLAGSIRMMSEKIEELQKKVLFLEKERKGE